MENTLNSRKKNGKILSPYTENALYCSDVYNLAQKLDNSVQIVEITGLQGRVVQSWVKTTQG